LASEVSEPLLHRWNLTTFGFGTTCQLCGRAFATRRVLIHHLRLPVIGLVRSALQRCKIDNNNRY
jgi:hypothetical protein